MNKLFLFFSLFTLGACTHTNTINTDFSSDSQALVHGWLLFDEYVTPVSTHIEVELCQVKINQCLTVARQEYQGVQLPVQYSFVVAPIQAGSGEMKVRAGLSEKGKLIASAEEEYTFLPGKTQKNIHLKRSKSNLKSYN